MLNSLTYTVIGPAVLLLQFGWNFKNMRSRLPYSTLETRNVLRLRRAVISVTSPVTWTSTSAYRFVRQNAMPGELTWNVNVLLSRKARDGSAIGSIFAVIISLSTMVSSFNVMINCPRGSWTPKLNSNVSVFE